MMRLNLHLTDNTQLRAEGYVIEGRLVAEVRWGVLDPATMFGDGALWGTPAMLRRFAELAVQAAIQAEEEAAWQARSAAMAAKRGRVA
jgi:hypothetical protein